jgi:MATE family multidrug resistance protein
MNFSQDITVARIWKLSFPLILTAMSGNLMYICDRLMVSQYSASSANAIASSQVVVAIFYMLLFGISSIAEVYVGQYNGAHQTDKVAKPVWQMIWFSLIGGALVIPIALALKPYLLLKEFYAEADIYFNYSVYCLFLAPLNIALSAFFIGRGETFIVTMSAIVANIVNFILNYILIFGTSFLAPQGVKGAVIATIIAQAFSCLILAAVFFNKKNNKIYKTRRASFDLQLLKECIKVGGATSIGHTVELLAWTTGFKIIASAKPEYLTVHVIGQTIFFMFSFLAEGLKQGVSTFASNLIGAKQLSYLNKLISKAAFIHIIIICCIGLIILFFSSQILHFFFPNVIEQGLFEPAKMVLFFVWLYILIDGFAWVIAGVLTSGGDTRFLMIGNILTSWLASVVPTYILLHIMRLDDYLVSWYTCIVYGAINLSIFYYRYKYCNWLKLDLSGRKRNIV